MGCWILPSYTMKSPLLLPLELPTFCWNTFADINMLQSCFPECRLLLFFSRNSSLLIRSSIRLILVSEYTHNPNTYQVSVQIPTLRNTDRVISGQKDKSQYINSLLLICHGGKNKKGNSIVEAAYTYSNCTFRCTASNLSTHKWQWTRRRWKEEIVLEGTARSTQKYVSCHMTGTLFFSSLVTLIFKLD